MRIIYKNIPKASVFTYFNKITLKINEIHKISKKQTFQFSDS